MATQATATAQGVRIHITGIVQGVGFRPFVYSLARRYGLTGWVRNTSAGVDIEADGTTDALAASLFHYRQLGVGQVKAYLLNQGIPIRS